MKTRLFILFITFFIQFSFGQTAITISGKVIDESFLELPGVMIIVDGKELATTDFDGKFQIEINKDICKLDFHFIGMESVTVTLKENCSYLEIILLNDVGCYLGASIKKVNRIRKRRFDNRSKLHKIANEKGIFSSDFFCGEMQFKPY